MYIEYLFSIKFFIFCLLISILLFSISFLFVFQKPEVEKYSSYECGFNPFEDARIKFEIKFYLVGILYIIFDLELIFPIPRIFIIDTLHSIGIISMLFFSIILTLGFYYERNNQALEW